MKTFEFPGINEEFFEHVKHYHPTGSKYICNPPVMDTDEDYIVLVDDMEAVTAILTKECGYTLDFNSANYPDKYFLSFKKTDDWDKIYNIILTDKKEYFIPFVEATELTKRLNITKKDSRVAIFNTIIEGYIGEKC